MKLVKVREVAPRDIDLEYLSFREDSFPTMMKEIHRAVKEGVCAMINGQLSLSLDEDAEGRQWVKVWLDTGKKDFPIYQEELPNVSRESCE